MNLWQELKTDIIIKRGAYSHKHLFACLFTDIEFQTILSYRIRHRLIKMSLPGKIIEKILWLLTIWYTSCHIQAAAKIEGGVSIVHANGIFIGADCLIKKGTRIFQQVTLGRRNFDNLLKEDNPILEKNVTIFAGAKVLGKIRIGENSIVGANAVVFKDVPDNMIAVGIPAVNKPMKEKINVLRTAA